METKGACSTTHNRYALNTKMPKQIQCISLANTFKLLSSLPALSTSPSTNMFGDMMGFGLTPM